MSRRTLFPPVEPYDTRRLAVPGGHELHVEQCGTPDGLPVVFLHGGPGGGVGPKARRFFDPARYRVVLVDQRGAGRSTPHASLEHNTTWDLVADLERVREHLGIERWVVFGGSWGSCLALAYAETHPERVSALVLRGMFLLRRSELTWFYQDGASRLFPEEWERYLAPIPEVERHDLMSAYHRRLTGPDPDEALRCAQAWTRWEAALSAVAQDPAFVEEMLEPARALAFARIENHYFVHGGFFTHEDQLLDGIPAVRGIPAVLVHGRYDVVCPVVTAYDVKARWPELDLRVVEDAGHSAFEPGITHELVEATDALADRLLAAR